MATIKKKILVRWLDANGKRVKPGTEGAKKVTEESSKFYGYRVPGYPKNKSIPLATSKSVSQSMLAKLIENGENADAGLIDPVAQNRTHFLTVVLEKFIQNLKAKGKASENQVKLIESRLVKVISGCEWKTVQDLKNGGDQCEQYLAERRKMPRKLGGISAASSNSYRTHLRQLASWMIQREMMDKNPFADLARQDADLDRRHARRDLSESEIENLLRTAQSSNREFRGLNGKQRAWLYMLASITGFRVGELSTLTPSHFELTSNSPVVRLAKQNTKNKKGAEQPLPDFLIPSLSQWLDGMNHRELLWPGTWREKAARMLAKDLAECNPPIPYVVNTLDGPTYADLHSLRHYYCTAMAQQAPIKVAMLAARHSSVTVTERYTHGTEREVAKAVNQIGLRMTIENTTEEEQPRLNPLEQMFAIGLIRQVVMNAMGISLLGR